MFLAEFDFYPKFSDDVRQRTKSGGILALISFALMIILFFDNIIKIDVNKFHTRSCHFVHTERINCKGCSILVSPVW